MSTRDVHRSGTAGATSSEHAPLWAIGLSLLLIAFGFARRRSGGASLATGDRRSIEADRGRSAETPSQIPDRGWKDILLRVYHGISETASSWSPLASRSTRSSLFSLASRL